MLKDKRKAPRKQMRYSAWVRMNDTSLHGCVLADISESGARLDVEDASLLPEQFVLLLAGRNGKARRYCRVVWRAPQQIGVQFEKSKPLVVPAATERNKRTAAAEAAAVTETA